MTFNSINVWACSGNLQPWELKPMWKCQEPQFIQHPLKAVFRNIINHLHTRQKVQLFTAKINMIIVWFKKQFGSDWLISLDTLYRGCIFLIPGYFWAHYTSMFCLFALSYLEWSRVEFSLIIKAPDNDGNWNCVRNKSWRRPGPYILQS